MGLPNKNGGAGEGFLEGVKFEFPLLFSLLMLMLLGSFPVFGDLLEDSWGSAHSCLHGKDS